MPRPATNDLPKWADPGQREENVHHVLRRLIETNDWIGIDVYGPEATLADDLTVDVLIHVEEPEESFIGIEVKTDPGAFQRSETLEQLRAQATTRTLDQLYVCAPQTDAALRLDIDPVRTQQIQQLEWSTLQRSFRGLDGTIELPNGNRESKSAFYSRDQFSEDRQRLIERAKREGDWATIEENLVTTGATLDGEAAVERGGEWVFDVLRKVGITRLDTETGELVQTEPAETIERTRPPKQIEMSEAQSQEPDVVHAVWEQYVAQDDTAVATEVELPSLTSRQVPNEIDRFLGARSTRSAARIDLLVTTGDGATIGIEAKGAEFAWDRLQSQLSWYQHARELDELVVALPGDVSGTDRDERAEAFPDVGVITVTEPRGKREVDRR